MTPKRARIREVPSKSLLSRRGFCQAAFRDAKVLAKGGLNLTERFNFDQPKRMLFQETKLRKNVKWKKQARLNTSESSTCCQSPHFANTTLYAGFFKVLLELPNKNLSKSHSST
ncbi:hypothetical protein ACM44_13770 [Chryseobacterium koreense CCUG 49689]|uniref:Uncharacterized protein n=1 Tax=Chryseobacterium koreense CCUG 49689 TaxID=1304281 RepID=A0A0J7LM69_9FLAO|nr:hypothetical protein ACM44_13770 [Chryseobacterium koreense CCUG 49689]